MKRLFLVVALALGAVSIPGDARAGINEGMLSVLVDLNAPHRFVQKISFTDTAAVTALLTTTQDGRSKSIVNGSMMAIQADQDFYFELRPTGATTAVTTISGSRPGVKVFAGQVFYFYKTSTDNLIDVVRSSSNGSLVVFLVDT